MVCFQWESFANALTFQGKGGGAGTFLQDAHKPHNPLLKVLGLSQNQAWVGSSLEKNCITL